MKSGGSGNFFLECRRQIKGEFPGKGGTLPDGSRILINTLWINAKDIVEEIDNGGPVKGGMFHVEACLTIGKNDELQTFIIPAITTIAMQEVVAGGQMVGGFLILKVHTEQGTFD